MSSRSYKLSPLLRVICMAITANSILILLGFYAFISGQWTLDRISVIAFGLTLYVMVALLRLNRIASSRIGAIAETAQDIIRTGDLSRRIPISDQGKEVQGLAGVLNRMLDEIEMLMHGTRTASDNIAHDLRHPLTRLRNRIESLRDTMPDKCAESQQQLTDLMAESDALLSTFQAILRISNIESARRHGGFKEVGLNAVVQDVIELYEPIAAEKHITVVLEAEPSRTIGDKDLIFQALTNLVDNAIKYTPERGEITIRLVPYEQGCQFTITDSGPGIADEHKPNVFNRFYRIDPSRSEPGSGLGLSLVNAIVKLHQGSITLADASPHGLCVTVAL